MRWLHKVKIKQLYTQEETHETLQASLTSIADVLDAEQCFSGFDTTEMRSLPEGDNTFKPVNYANVFMDQMYDFADAKHIWIE